MPPTGNRWARGEDSRMTGDAGTSALQQGELRLPPHARSVREARHFVRSLLADAGREAWADATELALSEIVTNGVLHAHTELVVRVEVGPDAVSVEVRDGNPALPAQRRVRTEEATTGRGLELVAALARECGVRAEPGGKVVWFSVADEPEVDERTEEDLLAAWDVDLDEGEGWPAVQEEVREVVLLGLPPTLWLAAREQHQACLRELVLYLAEHGDAVRPLDLELADAARTLVATELMAELDRAAAEGRARRRLPDGHPSPVLPDVPDTVDLRLRLPPRLGKGFGALQDALDAADQLAVEDRLLVRPALPEIIAVRDWLCEQVVAQLAEVPPSPWPGTDQERFVDEVHDRADAESPNWDSSLVDDSPRGVVAADDANRIIAISASLARTVGWAREELIGRRVVALIPPSLREAHVAGFSRHLTTGQANVLGVDLVLPVLHRDGSERECRFLVERADTAGGRPVYLAWIEPVDS